ncbi:BglG family transcription antiterminator [Pontibacillus marinus]|uniref:Transcriptional antiterminator n=1 Tax=Pontibacillus marinus BH030004 = DSM 16465 TaxID=1385511 RepID=A0A0A5GDA9_9BACI|nr:BglG family transcription antiterminator [Pontibacillus marinus]KGX91206.1 transcriptional antiterminator [Pontibacillus marinus BH030004 = DSM 16465]
MYVTGRERKILDMLLSQQDEPATIKHMAKELDVSTRTVHRDLKSIESLLDEYNLQLEKATEGQLEITGPFESKQAFKLELNQQTTLDYTPEERHVLILSTLLEAREPVKLIALASELGVTVATISHDLDKIEEDLSDFQLTLVRKRGYGVEIEGEESKIREAISYLIMRHMDELDFFSLLRQNIQEKPKNLVDSVSEQLLGLVNKDKLSLIEQHVDELRNELTYRLADSAYIGLVVHLALALERIQQGETINMDQEQLQKLRSAKEFSTAEKLIEKLSDTFELNIPEAETGYITMHLMGAKARYEKDTLLKDSSISIAFKTKQLIANVSKRINIDLHESERLLNDLVVHLKPSVYRLQQKMDIENTFTEQIEQDYPELFDHVEKALHEEFTGFEFPKEETAFVVMHFASALINLEGGRGLNVLVVCSSGVGTAKILAAKLQRQFKQIETVEHRSLFDLEKLDTDSFDLIVSTIALTDFESYVHVSPVLPQKDIQKIEHIIRRVQVTSQLQKAPSTPKESGDESLDAIRQSLAKSQRYAEALNQILNNLFVKSLKATDVEGALNEASLQLKQAGIISDPSPIVEHLLEREKIGGLGIPDTHLALYHARSSAVEQASFTIHVLEEPLTVQGMDQEEMQVHTILLMLAPEDFHQEGLEILSFISSLIVEEDDCTTILQSKDEERMIHYISNQLYDFYKSKQT